MNGQILDDSSCWPPLLARRVEVVCKRFEAARKASQRPRIEDYLADSGEPERSILLRELLALELEYSTKQGEQPTPQDFEHLFPQHPELIHEVFRDFLPLTPPPGPVRVERRAAPPMDEQLSSMCPTAPQQARDSGTPVWPGSEHDPVLPVVPGYDILGVLGRGGMGIVYRARDKRLDRLVALKMMLASAETTERSRFRSEARAVARLQHPHIVQIYEVSERDGLPYICLEYVDGGSLRDKLAGSLLSSDLAARLTQLVARAIHFAHQRGIIHRDLKPANILLVGSRESGVGSRESEARQSMPSDSRLPIPDSLLPKIADFGLAKRLDEDSGRTQTRSGALVGTPSYMAPEQATGRNREIGPAADIYALGAVLYEMLTGRPPFQAATVLETLEQVCSQDPVPPTRLQPKLPRDLETICLKCLQKEPRKRYASAEALADDLRCFLAGEPIRARPTPLWERGLKWVRRRPMAAALAVVVTLAAAGLVGGTLLYEEQRAGAAEKDARFAESELRDHRRVAGVRDEAQDMLAQSDAEKARGKWPEAKSLLVRAQAKVGDEPALADLATRIQDSLTEVQRRLDEQAARRRVRDKIQEFFSLYDETTFHLTPFTGADLPANLDAGRQTAQQALARFGVIAGSATRPAFDIAFAADEEALLTADERTLLIAGCYELLLILAESQAKEKPRQALATLDQAHTLGLHTKAYHIRRARYMELLHDPFAANEKEVASRRPAISALDHFLVGLDSHRLGMPPMAIREFEEALRLQPDHFWAHYFLAVCHLQGRHVSDLRVAKLHLSACLRQKNFAWAYLLRGWTCEQLGEFTTADQDFSEALKHSQNDNEVRYAVLVNRSALQTRQAVLIGRLTGCPLFPKDFIHAMDNLEEAIRLKPDRYQAYMNLAMVYQFQNNLAAAVTQLDKAINAARPLVETERLEPSALIRLYRDRGSLSFQRHDVKAALADFDRAIQVQPRDSKSEILAVVHAERGRILLSTKDYARAIAAYDQALDIHDKNPEAHLGRAEALLELRRFEDAALAFDRYFQHGGKPLADVYRKRAQAQAKLHKYSESIADYTLALTLEPKADTYANRGWIHVVSKAYKSALDDFDEAIRRDPNNGDAHNGRGLMRAKLGRSNADADAQEALRLGPMNPRHVWSAARIYAELVGRIDTDRDRRRNREFTARFDYQHEAVQLLRQALQLTDDEKRASFWHGEIEGDETFDPIRSSPSYAQLRAEFAANR